MRTQEKQNTIPPTILIDGGGKTYRVSLGELSHFLNTCQKKLDISGNRALEDTFQDLMEVVIEGVDNDAYASKLKHPLQFIRELDFLFRGLLYESKTD